MPKESQTDKRILFEMTGRRLNSIDFPVEDETDQEEDSEVLLDDMLGYRRSSVLATNEQDDIQRY